MTEGTSYMFVTGPNVVKTVTHEEVSSEDLGGASTHASKSGVAHFTAPNELDAIRIQGIECSVANQPFGIAKETPHVQLAQRLLQAIKAKASQDRFKDEGFRWADEQATNNE